MKTSCFSVLIPLFAALCFSTSVQAQQPGDKELKKAFAPKGTHRAPFKKADQVGLTSVNLQFKMATRQTQEKRGVGNIVTWGFLEGISDELLQEITDEYYQRLTARLKESGMSVTNDYLNTKAYQKLVENNAGNQRVTEKKNWGIAKVFTANNAPYLEYPTGMIGPHSSLGNDLKMPVGQLLITIDFISIRQKISGGVSDLWGYRTDKFETDVAPVIQIEGVTSASLGKMLKGDGTYAKFTGGNWSYCNAIMNNDFVLNADVNYSGQLEKAKGIPESMKKFKSDVVGDLAAIFSRGIVGNGRGTAENTFIISADPPTFKKAVLNALDKYNDYLIGYIQANN